MERSISQIRYDINHRRSNFRKSNESAPTGYKFLTNHNVENDTQIFKNTQWSIDNGFLVLPIAYHMYVEIIDNHVAIYEKIK